MLVSCGDTLYGLAANDGHVVWSLTRTGLVAGAAGVTKGLAQVSFTAPFERSTGPGLQLAVDARTGTVRWEVPVPNSGYYGFYHAPAVAGGLVVTCAETASRRRSSRPARWTPAMSPGRSRRRTAPTWPSRAASSTPAG